MATIADYQAWKAKQQQSGVGAANIVLGQEADPPDNVAADMQLGNAFAQATGKPVPPVSMVKQYKPVFQRAVEQAKASTVLSSSPMLANWLRAPDNANIARDDLDNLSWWERASAAIPFGLGSALNRGVQTVDEATNQLMAGSMAQRFGDQQKSFGEIYQEERGKVGPEGRIIDAFTGPITDLYFAGSRYLTAQLDKVFGNDTEGKAAFYQQRSAEIAQRIASIPMTPGAEKFKTALGGLSGDWQSQLAGFAGAVSADPGGFAEFLTQTAAEFAPEIAAAAAVTAITKNPGAGAVFLGGASGVVSTGTQTLDFVKTAGRDLTTPEGALAAIRDPGLLAEASKRGAAYGLTVGIIDGLSGGVAGQTLAKSPIGNMVIQTIAQALMGGAGEAAGEMAAGMPFDPVNVIVETLAEVVTAPIEVAGVGGHWFADGQKRAKAAETRKAFFEELSGQAVNSKVRERLPDVFRQFLEGVTRNGPVENVYIPAAAWAEYFQSKQIDPAALAAGLHGVSAEDFAAAIATGGDLKIPTATYAAYIAGSEHDKFLMENMRFSPDDFTSREAAEFNAKAQDAMEEAFAVAEAVRKDEDTYRAVETQIYDTMVSRLREAGRATDVATSEAMLYPAFYRTMAERSGLTVEEFLTKHPLPQVRGAVPAGMQLRDADALTRTLAEARARKTAGIDRGQSLLEFIAARGGIDDPGGEFKARDAEMVKRGKGKKTLKLARGPMAGVRDMFAGGRGAHGMDDVAQAAVEAGYLATDPAVLAWKEAQRSGTEAPDLTRALMGAIDRELRGEPHYATEETAGDGLDSVEEYLQQLGVSLDDSDAAIRKAIELDQAARSADRQFAQAPPVESAAFKRWFGDSKVVDAEGKPLVVYHGSPSGVPSAFDPTKIGSATDVGDIGRGFYFARQYGQAEAYAKDADGVTSSINVTRAYLALQNPLREFSPDFLSAVEQRVADTPMPKEQGGWTSVGPSPEGFAAQTRSAAITAEAKARGYDGVWMNNPRFGYEELVAFDPTQIKSVNNSGTFDPNDPRLLFQTGSSDPRGSIALQPNGDAIISLFAQADLSTFLHESGHYFLSVMQGMAADDPAGAIAAEFQAVKDWWRLNAADVAKDSGDDVTEADVLAALDNGTSGNASKDAAIDVGMQEQFARAFESYLMDGKAPSSALRAAFEKFRAWLVSVYRRALGLNVAVSDPMRAVFDRMLATDREIADARVEVGAGAPLTAEELGMGPEQHAAYLKLHDQATDEAHARLLADTMAPIRRATEKWFKEERKSVRADVERNLNASPVYRAIEWMGNRRWLGEGKPEAMPDFRLSKSVLVDRYGEGVLSTLNANRGQQTVYAVDGGLDPDDAAGWFGFSSGDALVKAIEQAPGRVEAIEAETDKVMRDRHGDALRDGSVEEKAMAAVHNDKRGQSLAAELAALNALAGLDRALTHREAREMARRTTARMQIRDAVRAERFLTAERKAGQEAIRAASKRDRPALVEATRRQLLNHALYSEARAVTEEVDKTEKLVGRLSKALARRRAQEGKQTISNEALDGIEEVIERYDFRRLSRHAEDRRGALNRYVEEMRAAGRENELAIPAAVLAEAERVPYRTLTVENLRGVVDTLKNLESTGRRWQSILIKGEQRDFNEAVGTIAQGVAENMGTGKGPTNKEKPIREGLAQYLSTFTTASTVIRRMDGREDLGPIYELLKSPIDDAAYTEREMRAEAADKIENLYSVYDREEQRRMAIRRSVPVLKGSFSKWELISMALNMGNEGNLHRLTNPKARDHLTEAQVEAVKASLDKRDWDFVQSVWDYIDSYRPKIAERQKRMTGVEPEWVDAKPVKTAHGTYRGGYYPIKYSRRQGRAATPSINGDADIIESMRIGGYAKAQTRHGHLEARVANVEQSLLFDVGVIAQHTNEVIHDLAFAEPIANTWRLLNAKPVAEAMLEAGAQEQHEALKLWLKDVAVGQVFASDFLSRTARSLRSGFTVSRLAFNLSTAMMQPTGLMQSATIVGKRNLANAIITWSRNPKAMVAEVTRLSRIMRERQTTFQKDLTDMVAETNVSSPTASKFRDFMNRYAIPASLALMTWSQFYLVDVPTWAAAFDKGMRQFGGDQTKASEYADMTINRTQGSGLWSERSNIERGTLSSTTRQSSVVTLFTTLGSYFFAKMNLLIERTDRLRSEGFTVGEAASYAFDVALLLAGEAAVMMLAGAAKDALWGDDDDKDKDDNPAMNLGIEAAKTFANGLPGIRDAASVMQGFSGGTYASILDLLTGPAKQAWQGKVDAALIKSFVNVGGLLARLPASQVNRLIDAGWRDLEGEDVSPTEYLLGRPKS